MHKLFQFRNFGYSVLWYGYRKYVYMWGNLLISRVLYWLWVTTGFGWHLVYACYLVYAFLSFLVYTLLKLNNNGGRFSCICTKESSKSHTKESLTDFTASLTFPSHLLSSSYASVYTEAEDLQGRKTNGVIQVLHPGSHPCFNKIPFNLRLNLISMGHGNSYITVEQLKHK